jgi:hypothetical protein
MGWSKTTRIKVMLAIDILFFFIELTVGFAVHSLALMADAFHMVSIPGGYVIARAGGLMRGGCSSTTSYPWLLGFGRSRYRRRRRRCSIRMAGNELRFWEPFSTPFS